MPNTYQRTTSVPAMGRFAAVHFASPVSLALRFGKSPAGQRSPSEYGVTQSVWLITWARLKTGEARSIRAGNDPDGTSL